MLIYTVILSKFTERLLVVLRFLVRVVWHVIMMPPDLDFIVIIQPKEMLAFNMRSMQVIQAM